MPKCAGRGAVRVLIAFTLIASIACDAPRDVPSGPDVGGPAFAKKLPATGISVTAATPAYGARGETGKPVTITGSGFAPGAIVTWERNGVVDANIIVQSAVVVSSTQIDAIITITESADLSLYDVGVINTDRKKGIGTEMFEVTTATSIGTLGGNTEVSATNDNQNGARAVGWSVADGVQNAFYWPDASGRIATLGPGAASGIAQDGMTVAGTSGGLAVTWKLVGSAWVKSALPVSTGISGTRVTSLVSLPDGISLLVSGSEQVKIRNGKYDRPRLWRFDGAAWTLDSLPMLAGATSVVVNGVNATGEAVGSGPSFWDANGSVTALPQSGAGAQAISADGSIVAGLAAAGGASYKAVYWQRIKDQTGSFGVWTGPFTLPGNCERAVGVDDQNRIIANRCLNSDNRRVSVIFVPPYDAESMITLNGTGNRTDGGTAWAISPNGTLIGGRGNVGGADVGIIWDSVIR